MCTSEWTLQLLLQPYTSLGHLSSIDLWHPHVFSFHCSALSFAQKIEFIDPVYQIYIVKAFSQYTIILWQLLFKFKAVSYLLFLNVWIYFPFFFFVVLAFFHYCRAYFVLIDYYTPLPFHCLPTFLLVPFLSSKTSIIPSRHSILWPSDIRIPFLLHFS